MVFTYPVWMSREPVGTHREICGQTLLPPIFLFSNKGRQNADKYWLSLNESKVFWCCWDNEEKVERLIIPTIWRDCGRMSI